MQICVFDKLDIIATENISNNDILVPYNFPMSSA